MGFTFDQVTSFAVVLVGVLGCIVLIGNAVQTLRRWYQRHRDPVDGLDQRISDLEAHAVKVDGKLEGDWEFRQDEAQINMLMLRSIKLLLQHEIDGNNIAGLKKMEDEIDVFLLEKSQG